MILNTSRRPKKKKKVSNMSISLLTKKDKIKGEKTVGKEKWSATFRGIFGSSFSWVFFSILKRKYFGRSKRKHPDPTTFYSSHLFNQTPTKNIFSLLFYSQFSIFSKIFPNKQTQRMDCVFVSFVIYLRVVCKYLCFIYYLPSLTTHMILILSKGQISTKAIPNYKQFTEQSRQHKLESLGHFRITYRT